MAGYGPAAMVLTPWGSASELRSRKLPAGRGTPPEEAARSQRERLFAAMVATVTTQGYGATSVADLERLSGVSRRAFYKHFRDKEDCFVAAVETLIEMTVSAIAASDGEPTRKAKWARAAFATFLELVVTQPAAARMCLVEAYAAGPRAIEVVENATKSFERFFGEVLTAMPGREGMPPELVRGIVGGMRRVIHKRLYRGEEAGLVELGPQMFEWALCYLAPPAPLRAPRRRPVDSPAASGAGLDQLDQVERLLRAMAGIVSEKGYPRTKVGEVVKRASTSQRTFYEHFADKEDALVAALDAGSAQMLAAILPAYRRAPDWPRAVRSALGAMLRFGAAEPEFTRLGAVEVFAAGTRALEQRDQVIEGLEALLAPGFERAPAAPKVAAEAIGGAISEIAYVQVRGKNTQELPRLAPVAAYLALAPFLGPDEACTVANSEPRRVKTQRR